MKLYSTLLLVLLSFVIVCCESDSEEMIVAEVIEQNKDSTNTGVTFFGDVQAIMNTSCAVPGCHVGTSPSGGVLLTSFETTVARAARINTRINSESNPMPPSSRTPLTTEEKQVIADWIANGLAKGTAPEDTVKTPVDTMVVPVDTVKIPVDTVVVPVDTVIKDTVVLSITYTDHIKEIMDLNCAVLFCHKGASPSAGVNLETFASVSARSARVNARVNSASNPMPPNGRTLLTQAQKDLIAQWIDGGLKE